MKQILVSILTQTLSQKIGRLIFVCKKYVGLVQSLLTQCVTSWGGAKTIRIILYEFDGFHTSKNDFYNVVHSV